MTKIAPFKALRPVRDKVHLVATRPYYSYKKNVLKAKLEDNPFTFLRIINPEFGTSLKTKPNSIERFNLVSEKYAEFIDEKILIKDQEAHLYIYRQTKDGHEFTGIVAGASVQEYEDDFIKKHEATLTSREAMFTNYLDIVGYNAEPVLLSYPHEQAIDDLLVKYTAARPEYEFTTTDRIKHELWVLSVEDSASMIKAFEKLPAAYIADGHHRSASSAGLKKHRQSKGTSQFPNEDYFLAYFIDENRLKILEFNRLVKTLNNLSKEEFLQKLEESFEISALTGSSKPSHEHQITMCLEGKWFELNCKPSIIDEHHPVKCLDAEILTQSLLTPILGIHDLKTDENIEFISGAETIESFEDKIVKGKFKVGFVLYPVSMDQVKRVADAQLIMPPKSTWVEPKMRSGLTIYNINE
jgi:uncharacterized protein (DUF1015 family)